MSKHLLRLVSSLAVVVGATSAFAQPPDDKDKTAPPDDTKPPEKTPPPPMTTKEAVTGPTEQPLPPQPPSDEKSPTLVKGKTSLTFYGFVQTYGIYDTTQNLAEQAQNTALQRPNTYTGDHNQLQFSARHSRFGLKLEQKVSDTTKVRGQIEMDFLGNQPANPPGVTETAFYQNATMRVRHAAAFVDSPAIDIIAGQYWPLFGWQSYFHPNSLEIQGLLGQVYKRTVQLRFGHTFKSDAVNVEIAVGAKRPPQRAAGVPDGEAGLKIIFNKLKGWRTKGFNDSLVDAGGLGVSVIGRKLSVDEFKANPSNQVTVNGYGLSLDAYIPIALEPASKESHGNSLALTGSFVMGAGIADQYDGLTFGVTNPACTGTCNGGAAAAGNYTANIDNGLAHFAPNGTDPVTNLTTFKLHAIQSVSYMVGLQYYLPPRGKVWLAANYTHVESANADSYGLGTSPAGKAVWNSGYYVDAMLFIDATSWLRLGISGSLIDQTFTAPICGPAGAANCVMGSDASTNLEAKNYRGMGSVILLF
jgi:hypothetical protein